MKIRSMILALSVCGGLVFIPALELFAQRGGGGRGGGGGGGGGGGRTSGHNAGGGQPGNRGGGGPAMSHPQGGGGRPVGGPNPGNNERGPGAGREPGGKPNGPAPGGQRPGGEAPGGRPVQNPGAKPGLNSAGRPGGEAPGARPGQNPGAKPGATTAGRPGAEGRPETAPGQRPGGPGPGGQGPNMNRRPSPMDDFVGGGNNVADRGRPGARPGLENRPGTDSRPGLNNRPGVADNGNRPGTRPGLNQKPGDTKIGNTNTIGNTNNVANKGGDTNINVGNVNVGNKVNYADNKQAWVNNQHNNGNVVRANSGNRYWGAYNNPGFHAAAVGGYPYYGSAGWRAPGYGWQAATWAGVGAFMGASIANSKPVYYAYGTGGNVYYENNVVYVDGQASGTPQEYSQQASALVAAAPPADAAQDLEWMPLGVFAFTREDVHDSQQMLELAVTKDGVIAGTFYNEATGASRPIKGTTDLQSQRVAMGFADGKNADVVLETGISNLTEDEAPALLHFGTDQSQPVVLVRLQQPQAQ